MGWEDAFKFVTASLASIGVGGAIVFGLSSWLGKLWASRILDDERHKLGAALEKTKSELEVLKETTLRFQNDKILAYRAIVDVVARILASLDSRLAGALSPQEAQRRFDEFNEQRMRVYGYLAMLAPQAVMDAQDRLMDHIIKITSGSVSYEWLQVRTLAIALLNEIRVDVGIDKDPIAYRGEL